jgi:hypothetical protein
MRLIILPIEEKQSGSEVLGSDKILSLGNNGMSQWLSNAERFWTSIRKEKADKWDIYQLIDYRKQLSNQKPNERFKVLFNASGTYLNSSVINSGTLAQVSGMDLMGFIVDDTAVYYDCKDQEEAFYLCAIFNSNIMNELIKPIQSHGLWGPRHIHKKPLELPIEKFKPANENHLKLSKIGQEVSEEAFLILPNILNEMKIDPSVILPTTVGRLRNKLRGLLQSKIEAIDNIILELFTNAASFNTKIDFPH